MYNQLFVYLQRSFGLVYYWIIYWYTFALSFTDKDGNIVKRVTSADSNDIEDPESSLTPNPSPTGEGSGNSGGDDEPDENWCLMSEG